MTLSPVPDLKSRGQLALVAMGVWVIAAVSLLVAHRADLNHALGDPDDALRLSMVRDLVGGQGWFDQKLARMQPPLGLYMHWSRLVDGGEAGLIWLFSLILPHNQAEMAMRITWPLLWLAPATTSVLLVARRLAGGRAVFLTAVSVALSVGMSGQFVPGRIDHHNVQIACCLMAFAAAVQAPSVMSMIACALATALGLAVGLEALPFHAAIGAALGLAWAFGRNDGRTSLAYGAALALGAVGLAALQTPPGRWLTPVCDALAINLVAGLAVAGLGLALAAWLCERLGRAARIALLAVIRVAAALVYLGLFPVCVGGPLAQLDPELKRVWQAHVSEMAPWPHLVRTDPAAAFAFGAPVISGLLGWLWLGRRAERRAQFSWLLTGALLLAGAAMTWTAIRSAEYAVWFSAPMIGAAVASAAATSFASRMIPAALLLIAINVLPGWAISAMADPKAGTPVKSSMSKTAPVDGLDPCIDAAAMQPLARLPTGLVLSEIDQGPYILATTRDSTLEAPYHRMTWGIKASRAAYAATPAAAEAKVRALGVTYILNCPSHVTQSDRWSLPRTGLQFALDHGQIPAWLEPLSAPDAPLQIYRVRRR